MSARISTKGKRSIRYGKVEVRAKLHEVMAAIWMLPETTLMVPASKCRGNGPTYPAHTNYVRGSLNWTYGWWTRVYVDNRLQHMLNLRFDVPFFERGKFPTSVANASQEIILPNPWAGRGNSAPFDQPFYLILDVAVGGTNGWFPDGAGNKPWLNGAINAMQLFAQSQDKWSETWPESEEDRAMRIDYVKMWEQC
ncbi:concanavalin A-like lectin/glucanase domain-containing protein [Russula vinacea]|nr:concanavalin A-like lectin/glucanase domain-containing protein [Russula vinacea]